MVGREGAARPDPVQAAWLYAQMVRWGQAPLSPDMLKTAEAVFRPDLYDAALGKAGGINTDVPDAVGAMVPTISPLLVIDTPGGRPDAANRGDCPAAALSDVTCNWIAVPAAFCWLLGSSSRTAAWRK